MSEQSYHIHSLTKSILNYLQENRNQSIGVNLVLQLLNEINLSNHEVNHTLPDESRHENILDLSVKDIKIPHCKKLLSN